MPIENAFVPPQEQIANPEIAGLIEALFSEDGATQKTVLTPRQVIVLARAKAFGEMYKIPDLIKLCDYLMQLKISQNGRGRTDLIKALQSRRATEDDEINRNRRERDRLGLGR